MEDKRVKLQIGNSVLPMPWDVAIRMGTRIRVYQRDAQEYIGMARTLTDPDHESGATGPRKAVREAGVILEGDYEVFADGPDTVMKVNNAELTMTPEVARNISTWLIDTGKEVRDTYFGDMRMQLTVANLTDGVEQRRVAQSRRDATAAFH